uniref:SEA domain-containing protein n=1 Tax=Magallana gigas TaxID=29159 RepID=K1PK89_MAGGI
MDISRERDYLPESSYSFPPNEYYDNPLYSHPTKVGHSALGVYPDYLPQTPSTLYPYGYRSKEGSLDRLHETASSRSRSRKTARIVWTLVAVVFVTAIVAGTAVIIYLTSQSSNKKEMPKAYAFKGSLKSQQQWNAQYSDKNSAAYRDAARDFEIMMKGVYTNTDLEAQYGYTTVEDIKEGSVVFVYVVVFYPPSSTSGSDVTVTSVQNHLQQAVTDGKISQLNPNIVVDPTTTVSLQAPPQPIIFDGTIKVNQTWDDKLNDTSNPEYQTVKDDFENTMDTLYRNSSFGERYNSTHVTGIQKGSIIFIYIIIFNPDPPTPPPPTPSTNSTEDKNVTSATPAPTRPVPIITVSMVTTVLTTAITTGEITKISTTIVIDETSVVEVEGTR